MPALKIGSEIAPIGKNDMKTCKTCKWWDRERIRNGYAECDRVQHCGPSLAIVECGADDDQGLYQKFMTDPSFGCVQHEDLE